MQRPGISGFSIYVPSLRVDLKQWSGWRNQDWSKVQSVVGTGFRVCDANENAYTMAAGAVLNLIDAYQIQASAVGMLVLATESSTDNAVGAAIVRGLVDAALVSRGQSPLASDCEVPELKQACLAGIYGVKHAVRWLQTDGRGRVAIVVASDIAEYELGSSGEQTQGAGAVAMLVDEHADLLIPMLDQSGSSSRFRGIDFRKPVLRHLLAGTQAPVDLRARDFPVFNGKYSALCYADAVLRAFAAMCARREVSPVQALATTERILMHRPYRNMPRQGLSWLASWAAMVAKTPAERSTVVSMAIDPDLLPDELRRAAQQELATLNGDRQRWSASPSVSTPGDDADRPIDLDTHTFPSTSTIAADLRASPAFRAWSNAAMSLGDAAMQECGNLYTASLPAWLAAALDEAVSESLEIAGERWLAIGYGSGDAAECIPVEVSPRWRTAAAKIRFSSSFADAVDLNQASYERRHAGEKLSEPAPRPFAVTAVGRGRHPSLADVGIETYAVRTSWREVTEG